MTSGQAVVLGCDLRRRRGAVRRRGGRLGHAGVHNHQHTPQENQRVAVRAAGGDRSRVAPALDRLELGGRVGRTPVGRLSAGQRRRAALAVLVARDPELWLLDEPHAALDAGGRALVGSLVVEAARAGATVLIASHEPEATLPLADRVVTVAGGRVVDGGEPVADPVEPARPTVATPPTAGMTPAPGAPVAAAPAAPVAAAPTTAALGGAHVA